MKVNPINTTPFAGILKVQSSWNLGTNMLAAENIKRIEADNNTDNVKILYQEPDTDELNAIKLRNTDPTFVLSAYAAALAASPDTIIDISA